MLAISREYIDETVSWTEHGFAREGEIWIKESRNDL